MAEIILSTDVWPTPGPAAEQPAGSVEVTEQPQKAKASLTNLKRPEMNWVPLRPRMKRITWNSSSSEMMHAR